MSRNFGLDNENELQKKGMKMDYMHLLAIITKGLGFLKMVVKIVKSVFTPQVQRTLIQTTKNLHYSMTSPTIIRFGEGHLFGGTVFAAGMAVLIWLIFICCASSVLCTFSKLSHAPGFFLFAVVAAALFVQMYGLKIIVGVALGLTRAASWGFRHYSMKTKFRKVKVIVFFL